MTTRVLVVDDHPVFRDGLAAVVAAADDLALTGTAADAEAALATAAEADIVLMDLNLPGMSGVDATRALAARVGGPAVLVITMVDDDDTVIAAMQAGARGYVLKGSTAAEIVAAIRTVAGGGAVFGAGVAARILSGAASLTRGPSPAAPLGGDLTAREQQVLALLADGLSNSQIARQLSLSLKTVQNYVSHILDKLQVQDRTQAALQARGIRPEQR
jgi:DNA-binding NarL/FixJ family response regulator